MKKPFYKPAVAGFCFTIVAVLVAVMAPMGSRIGWWSFNFSVEILTWSAYIGVLASLLCLAGVFRARPRSGRRGLFLSLLGLVIIVPLLVLLAYWNEAKQNLPPIQDITTDTINPPDFWFAPNPRLYGGPETAALQREAYPDIEPVILAVPIERAFELALAVIRDMGWEVLGAEPDAGRIEATESTFWYGFSDDVVVRITKINGESRIDVRSTSRFGGGGDGGTNAARVRRVLNALKEKAVGDK